MDGNHSSISRNEIIYTIITALSAMLVLSYSWGSTDELIGDPYLYFIQSLNPLSVISPPHGLRWLTPRLAYIMPFSISYAFYAITLISLAGTLLLAYFNLRILGCNKITSAVILSALISNPGFHDALYYYIHADPLSFFLIELGILSIYTDNDRLFSLSLLLGVLNRETSLFLIPVYHFARHRQWYSWTSTGRTLRVCSSALLIFILTRFLLFSFSDTAYFNQLAEKFYSIDPGFKRFDQYYIGEIKKIWSEPGRIQSLLSARIFCSGFESIIPLSFIGFIVGSRKYRALILFLLCIWSQLFYALMVERLMFYTFPVYLIGCGLVLRHAQEMKPVPYYIVLGILLFSTLYPPYNLAGGVVLVLFMLYFLYKNKQLLSHRNLSPVDGLENHSVPEIIKKPYSLCFSWLNALIILTVTANIACIYQFRPTLVSRLNPSFPSIRQVAKMNLQDDDIVYTGDAEISDFRLNGTTSMNAFSVKPDCSHATIFIPIRSELFQKSQDFFLMDVVYPVAASELSLSIVGPRSERNPSKLYIKDRLSQKYGFSQRIGMVRKSLPLYFQSDLPDEDYAVIRMTPSLLLLDMLVFEGGVYAWFQRKDTFPLKSNSIELN